MHFIGCFNGGSQIRFTVWFSFRTELGSMVHHVLKKRIEPCENAPFMRRERRHIRQVASKQETSDLPQVCHLNFAILWAPIRSFPRTFSLGSCCTTSYIFLTGQTDSRIIKILQGKTIVTYDAVLDGYDHTVKMRCHDKVAQETTLENLKI